MYYVIWFDKNQVLTTTYAAYTSNIVYAKRYLFHVSMILKSEGHLQEVETLKEVRELLVECGDATISGRDIGENSIRDYEIIIMVSHVRPNYYTLITEEVWSDIMEIFDYGGGLNAYTLSKMIAQLQVKMKIMSKNTPIFKALAAGVHRISQYLYAYGVVEEHFSAIVEGDYDEGESTTISAAINECNLPLYDIVDTTEGFNLIDITEYVNAFMYDDLLFIRGGVDNE